MRMTFPDIFWVSLFAGVSGKWKKDRALLTEVQYPAFDKVALEFWSTFAMRADWDWGARRPDI